MDHRSPKNFQALFTNDIYYGWQWMGQQWERSLFCQFQLLGSYWKVHWLKLAPGLKKVQWGKLTPPNIFFRPILPNFEKKIEIGDDDFGGWSMLPVRKTAPPPFSTRLFSSSTSRNAKHIEKTLQYWGIFFHTIPSAAVGDFKKLGCPEIRRMIALHCH